MVTMKKFIAAFALLLVVQSAWAIDIRDAKAQGLVGEANSGYLAAVATPANAEVRALIAEVNEKRRAQFERTAQQTGTTVSQVANRFYELAVQKTSAGNYYQDAGGSWRKK
jgi:uncharacterized protein YdbL (DUF1318 family)